jgi:hypothetical protein
MSELRTANVFGRRSFLMKTHCVDLALTVTGGHLAPVTFFPQEAHPIQPYAIAPWWSEPLEPQIAPLLATLRGDFFCSAFGTNAARFAGRTLSPHGETANGRWHTVGHGSSTSGCWLQLGMELSERAETGGRPSLEPDVEITDLHQVPCTDGSTTDLTRFPARGGFEDLAILCADPTMEFAWSAVAFPEPGFVWFSFRDPRQLSCTLLWFSNGGRDYSPWNGRHVNVMGIEDMTGYFDMGLAASSRRNPLTERGVRTSLNPDGKGRISIPYIQGVARIPHGFDRVATTETTRAADRICLRADSGNEVTVPCHTEFLKTGQIPELMHLPSVPG